MPNLDIRTTLSRIDNLTFEFDNLVADVERIKKGIPNGQKLSSESPEKFRAVIQKITNLKIAINNSISNKGVLVELVEKNMRDVEKIKTLEKIKKLMSKLKQEMTDLRTLELSL